MSEERKDFFGRGYLPEISKVAWALTGLGVVGCSYDKSLFYKISGYEEQDEVDDLARVWRGQKANVKS